jgi:catechol 2,3-dioxygenase-like lactoylglutathione lyase family enzyme
MSRGDVRELRVALTVDDYAEALAFYRDALGMPELAVWEAPEGQVVLLDAGRATLELLDAGQAARVDEVEVGRRVAGHVRLALEVDDSDAVAARLVEAGAEQLAEAVVTPWRDRNVRLQAPDGMQLTLFTVLD